MFDKNQQQQTVEQWMRTATSVLLCFLIAFGFPVQMWLRPRFATRYLTPIQQLLCILCTATLLPLGSMVQTLASAFSHHPAHALFGFGTFYLCFTVGNIYHNFRTFRLMVHPEREFHSRLEGDPWSFFNRLPKGDSWFFVKLVYEPVFVFLLSSILSQLHIIDTLLAAYFYFAAICLFLSGFIEWFMYWEADRDRRDYQAAAQMISRIENGTATTEERTKVNLASVPRSDAAQTNSQPVRETGAALPKDLQNMVSPLQKASIIIALTAVSLHSFAVEGRAQVPPAPPSRYVFVVNNDSNTVSVIDGDKVVKTIEVGLKPPGVAVSPLGTVYVTQADNGKAIKATNGPRNEMTDHRLAREKGGTVTIIDSHSLTVTGKIQVDTTPVAVSFSPDGKTALVACKTDDVIDIIDVPTRKLLARIDDKLAPSDVKFIDNERAIAVNSGSAEAVILDLATRTVTKRFRIIVGAKTVTIHQGKAYAGGFAIDLQTFTASQVPIFLYDGGVVLHGQNAYAADNIFQGNLVVTSLPSGKISRLPIGPYPFAMAVSGDTAYITVLKHPLRASGFSQNGWQTNTGDGEVVLVSLSTLQITGRIPVESWPIAIATMLAAEEPAMAAPVMPIAEPAQPQATGTTPGPPLNQQPPTVPTAPGPATTTTPPPTVPAKPPNPIDSLKQSVKSFKSLLKKVRPQ